MTTKPIVHDAGCASSPTVEIVSGAETGRIIIRPCDCSASRRLSLTLVENRRVDRSTRYTMYLNDDQGCTELACGPTATDAYVDALAALEPILTQLRDRTVEAEIISTELAETLQDITGRALSVQEYCAKYGPKA